MKEMKNGHEMKFLERTARYLVDTYGEGVSGICIVLPSRRGGLYLKKYLARYIGKASWAPEIYAIEDFILKLSGLTLCENIRLLFELYEVHCSREGDRAQPFRDFMGWGQQLLHDFNEVDSYLVDPDRLFGYLSEAKALSVWNPGGNTLTDTQRNYLDFFNSLGIYHRRLKERLLASGTGYPGLTFRVAAERIDSTGDSLEWEKILFVGLNALTAAEEKIVDVLLSSGRAETLWDADEYYLGNDQQEAGVFLRKWKKKWKNREFMWTGTAFRDRPKSISITGVPLHVGQVKYCGELLGKKIREGTPPEEIAVVMMDEKLLIPLLNSLPDDLRELNITMGYPLKLSPMFSLLEALFRMQENLERFSEQRTGGKTRFYFRDVLRILQHPLIARIAAMLSGGNHFVLDDCIAALRSPQRIFVGIRDITGETPGLFSGGIDFLKHIFTAWNSPAEALGGIRQILGLLIETLTTGEEDPGETGKNRIRIEREFLFSYSLILHQVGSLLGKYNPVKDIRTLHALFIRAAESTSLPFYGEPLKGTQVMGMLETRTLDFETVILLSANEDLLPSGKSSSTFIPYDIRKDFGLPTHHHKNSVYAYHFYRLIQRAKDVAILYNTEPDELGGGEKSRFISQVVAELPLYNQRVQTEESLLGPAPPITRTEPGIVIPKSGEVLEKLKEKASGGIGPTQLNNYRQCPLRFYYHEIAGLEEPEELEEEIDRRTLGTIVHTALQLIYESMVNRVLIPEILRSRIKDAESLVDRAFRKESKGRDLSYGRNLLTVKLAKLIVMKFLESEIERVSDPDGMSGEVRVKYLEVPLERHLSIPAGTGSMDIRIRGFADRVDISGKDWLVLDYKTGKVDPKELKIKEWEDLRTGPGLDKSFQVITYAWLLEPKVKAPGEGIRSGIISFRKLSEGIREVSLPGGEKNRNRIRKEDLAEFGKILEGILKELFDESIPFRQAEDHNRCLNCPYLTLCGR
jgi:CRISPR/Cas system-associated exonuclease Cas4 (RecB family)